jgi:hypothetical protein
MNLLTRMSQLCKQLARQDRVADLDEARKMVVRHGQRRTITTCPPGRRSSGGRCVPMSGAERQHRRRGARHGLTARRRQRSQASRSRARSMALRRRSHLS